MTAAGCTLERYEREFAGRHLLHGVVDWWAARRPAEPALVGPERGLRLSWGEFARESAAMARRLAAAGFRKGDFLAVQAPFTLDHILLEYACFRAGVIHVPLDMRLPPVDVERAMAAVGARALYKAADAARLRGAPDADAALPEIGENDGVQVIFTTGSTGAPKPALLSHRNITSQNLCLGTAFGFNERGRVLVNLPPSHVGGQAEVLMTTLFFGGAAVVLEAFDAARSLEAIAAARVTLIGQIPAMFHLEWRHSAYANCDFSSLEIAVWGGQQVSAAFLARLPEMARRNGTGLGLTEAAGFCTYTTSDDAFEGLGIAAPIYPMTIRAPMEEDGRAGAELSEGEIGHVCFRGPQTFLGYVNDPESTRRAISSDGWLYTGDMGRLQGGSLLLSGRSKWVIKPGGYQVFPGDVETFLASHEKVLACGVVGVPHEVFSEAIVAFVEPRPGVELDAAELKRHARAMASYMRPARYVILPSGGLPLNRVAKTDYLQLQKMAASAR